MADLMATGRLAEIKAALTPAEVRALTVCLCDSDYSAAHIARTLTRHGHKVSATTIKGHRAFLRENGLCE